MIRVAVVLAIVGGTSGFTVEFDGNAEAEWSSAGSWSSNSLPCAGDLVTISAAASIDATSSLHLTVGTISSSAAQRFVHGIDFDALHDTFIEFEGSDDGASLIFFDDGLGCGASTGDSDGATHSGTSSMPSVPTTATATIEDATTTNATTTSATSTAATTRACIDSTVDPDCAPFRPAQCGALAHDVDGYDVPRTVRFHCPVLCGVCGLAQGAEDDDVGGDGDGDGNGNGNDVDASAAAENADDNTAGDGATIGFILLFLIFAGCMEMLLWNLDTASLKRGQNININPVFTGKGLNFMPTTPSDRSSSPDTDLRQVNDRAKGDAGRGVDNMMYAVSPGTMASTTFETSFAADVMSPAGDLGLGSQAPPPASPYAGSPPTQAIPKMSKNGGFEHPHQQVKPPLAPPQMNLKRPRASELEV